MCTFWLSIIQGLTVTLCDQSQHRPKGCHFFYDGTDWTHTVWSCPSLWCWNPACRLSVRGSYPDMWCWKRNICQTNNRFFFTVKGQCMSTLAYLKSFHLSWSKGMFQVQHNYQFNQFNFNWITIEFKLINYNFN